ncbi:unnamed protein product [Prorocentrum cordatum]|uniref:Zinc-ribbon domain-containing protein n=1 Tax=Prorocentrum cordatum TaxID=2364126 RepID=A0ABN9RKP7_9DINO|nr:unnamed protein product [Polarella glacialis]
MRKLLPRRTADVATARSMDVRAPLKWECPAGHRWTASLDTVRRRRHWCLECVGSPTQRLTIHEATALARKRGGYCRSEEYVNLKSPLLWECSQGHTWKSSMMNVKHGQAWCPECARSRQGPRRTMSDARPLPEKRQGCGLIRSIGNAPSRSCEPPLSPRQAFGLHNITNNESRSVGRTSRADTRGDCARNGVLSLAEKPCGGRAWVCTEKGFAQPSVCTHRGLLYSRDFTGLFQERGRSVFSSGLVHVGREVPRWVLDMVSTVIDVARPDLNGDTKVAEHLAATVARFISGGRQSYVSLGCSHALGVVHVDSVHVAEAVGHAAIRSWTRGGELQVKPWAGHYETYSLLSDADWDGGAMDSALHEAYDHWRRSVGRFVLQDYGQFWIPARTQFEWAAIAGLPVAKVTHSGRPQCHP